MLAHPCTDDDLLHWAVGLDPIPSLTEIRTRVANVIAKARQAIPLSLQKAGLDVRLEGVSEAYKVSSGKVLIFVEFADAEKYQKAGQLSPFFTEMLRELSGAGLDTSIVLLHEKKATAAINSSANPNVVFIQKDDFDPDRPNVASSLRGARAISFGQLAQDLDALTGSAGTQGADPVTLSPDRDSTNRGAQHRSYGEGVSARSLPEGEQMTGHIRRTHEVDERIRYLASGEFTAKLTRAVQRAVEAAIDRHHEAGLPAHGEHNGVIVEYARRQKK